MTILARRGGNSYELGMNRVVATRGRYDEHGGGGGNDGSGPCGVSNQWMTFPNGYATVVMSNTANSDQVINAGLLQRAFDASSTTP
ncbi:MAG: hypothetical protein IPL61_05920 [Myxococcales bacterium]|nr:hypothetical protein [Myxococcales bacterium]